MHQILYGCLEVGRKYAGDAVLFKCVRSWKAVPESEGCKLDRAHEHLCCGCHVPSACLVGTSRWKGGVFLKPYRLYLQLFKGHACTAPRKGFPGSTVMRRARSQQLSRFFNPAPRWSKHCNLPLISQSCRRPLHACLIHRRREGGGRLSISGSSVCLT